MKKNFFYAAIFHAALSALYIPAQSYGAGAAVARQARPIPAWCKQNAAAAPEPANSYKYVVPFPADMPVGIAFDGGAVNHYNECYDIHFSVGEGAINRLVELMTNGNADKTALIQWFDNRSEQIKTYLEKWPINLDYYRPEQPEKVTKDELTDLIVSAI